jgi:hypothetical protein
MPKLIIKNILNDLFKPEEFDELPALGKIKYSVYQFSLFFSMTILIAAAFTEIDRRYIFDIAKGMLLIIFTSQYVPLLVKSLFGNLLNKK